jgi:hypothetical protein
MIFKNPLNLIDLVILWRLHKIDPQAKVNTYIASELGIANTSYVDITSTISSAQIESGLATPITTKETAAINKRLASLANAQLATALKTVTADEADAYIENTVTNIATAKVVLKQMARLLVALRDHTFSEIDV